VFLNSWADFLSRRKKRILVVWYGLSFTPKEENSGGLVYIRDLRMPTESMFPSYRTHLFLY
jgi:hypothetical protein